MSAWTGIDGGVLLTVRATPKGGRDRIDGLVTDATGRSLLSVRVSVAQENGAANAAVIALVASELRLAKRDVVLASGATSRVKRLHLNGNAAEIMSRLELHTKDVG